MTTRKVFSKKLADLGLSHTERAIAFLWYYRQTQEFEERTASELANDLFDDGFPKPNISRLHTDLTKSRCTIKGHRKKTFQLDLRKLHDLDEKYLDLIDVKKVDVTNSIIPFEWVSGTRIYLEQIVHQINGSYDYGFYDCCAVLCRRLMESLLLEIYISQKRHHEIQNAGVFLALEKLINFVKSDKTLVLSRNTAKNMLEMKQLGDTAAHDRVYITHKSDIDDIKAKYRRVVHELLAECGIRK